MLDGHVEGSDPGLCVAHEVPRAVVQFGHRCQSRLVTQHDARQLAADSGIHLEGLAGSQDGVIGALAAVGLAFTHRDGRVVQLGEWPDDLSGRQPITKLHERGLEVRLYGTNALLRVGEVDVGKRLRPNRRDGRDVLFVKRLSETQAQAEYLAVKLP
jgi:hypothetical protein